MSLLDPAVTRRGMEHRTVEIECSSSITAVDVFARGAVVTRSVVIPDGLPPGVVTLRVGGITPLAEPGSLRVVLHSDDRTLRAVRSALVVPARGALPGPSVERVRELQRRRARMCAERDHLLERRRDIDGQQLAPSWSPRANLAGDRSVARRTDETLATAAMLAELAEGLDRRRVALDESLRSVDRELDAARLADAQARSAERRGDGHPTRDAMVELGGEGPLSDFEISYAVPAARWWPIYTLRLSDGGRRATWWVEALVAQLTGEDWTRVKLSLSTADLLFDARLPELPSMRLGRAQPPPRPAFRAPPPGLEALFAGYDRAFGPLPAAEPVAPVSHTIEGATDAPYQTLDLLAEVEADEEPSRTEAPADTRRQEKARLGRAAPRGGAPGGYHSSANAPPPPPMQAGPMPMETFAPQPARKSAGVLSAVAAVGAAPFALAGAAFQALSRDEGGGAAPAEPEAIEPSEGWMDYDALVIRGADGGSKRGRLARRNEPQVAGGRIEATRRTEGIEAPLYACDPHTSRGMFDHRYDADGRADVPSDGRTHRVSLGSAEASPTMRWRTVPRERPEVYREVELKNPFDAPLLTGPVEVYVEGTLLVVTGLESIDRGGAMHVGLGVDERLKVARNVRTREETAGLLGGDTVITTEVSIEVSSGVSTPALVDVIDRTPVSDDKHVEIELTPASEAPEVYQQVDRGSPVRAGRRWKLIVPAGGKATVKHGWKMTIPSKSEVVGGNRRD